MIDFFILGLTFILMHEMDAIRCREWRMFPGLSLLGDRVGLVLFLFLHIPIFYWVIEEAHTGNEKFRIGFGYFLIFHFIVHLILLLHKKNEFRDWISWTLITGAGLFGLLDILTI